MSNLALNAAQHIFLNQLDTKFSAYVGGFGSGKTFTGCLDLILFLARHPGTRVAYFGISFGSIRDVFYPTFEEAATLLGFNIEIKYGDKEIHVYRGKRYYGTVICRSLDNPGSIVGFKVARALVDELDVLPTDKALAAWQKVIARLRLEVSGEDNKVRVTTTPEGFKTTYNLFAKEPKKSYGMVQASTYENQDWLPEGYIESLIETYPSELIDAYINGDFVNLTAGTVYRSFDRKIHNSTEKVAANEVLHVGMDFNVDRMCAIVVVERGSGYHVVDEIRDAHDTKAVGSILQQRYPGQRIIVYPDSSGKNRSTATGKGAAESDIALLRQDFGFECRYKSRNPPIKDRVAAVNKAFELRKLYIHTGNCRNLVECLEQQAYDKNGVPDKQSGHDHANDALGYFVYYTMPIVKPVIDVRFTRAYV